MKTAVEWLEKEIKNKFDFTIYNKLFELLEQAKEMFEQQIIDAYESGIEEGKMRELSEEYNLERYENAEQYYNETFKK